MATKTATKQELAAMTETQLFLVKELQRMKKQVANLESLNNFLQVELFDHRVNVEHLQQRRDELTEELLEYEDQQISVCDKTGCETRVYARTFCEYHTIQLTKLLEKQEIIEA